MANKVQENRDVPGEGANNIIAMDEEIPNASLKKKKTRRPQRRKSDEFGSSKGIETMFRSAYRAQLDLIALAATKANIMISLNGFIVSVLMVSGAFIYASVPVFLPPAIVFLITSAISIYFALWAASPGSAPEYSKVFRWARNFITGKAAFSDIKECVDRRPQNFIDGESNILVFEDFAKLSKEEYLERMHELLSDHGKVYETMSDQLYWLGNMADKKFKMLRSSYAVFRWGIILSILMFLIVKLSIFLIAPPSGAADVKLASGFGISKFDHIYEPSGVEQLPDGRLVIIEDEPSRALRIASLKDDGSIVENRILDEFLIKSFRRKLDDLEGVTVDNDGYAYAITSHSRTGKGKELRDREQLIRFRVEGNRLVEHDSYRGLGEYIEKTGLLKQAARSKHNGKLDIDIEALSFDKDKEHLLIGFRDPQIDGKSVIAVLENPQGIFENDEKPRISDDFILLDLDGGGIRSLVYDPHLDGYLLSNEVAGDGKKMQSRIWFWDGDAGHDAQHVELPGLINMTNLEGITPVTVAGKSRILIISDDGNAQKKDPAHYLILDYMHLSTEH
ncbi:MAG: Pycsar system effector family protein [Gammaproteobacteria bacterium]